MNDLSLRLIDKNDILELQKIGRETFYETFVDSTEASDMELFLENSFNKKRLESELNNPESEFYFAEHQNKVVGYLKINTGNAQNEKLLKNSLEIERIYVLSEYLGKNVGKTLFEKALEIAKKKFDYVWLGVWENNNRAIHFYEKNGFIKFGKHKFIVGTDEQTDVIMKLKL
jgi:hypothetical protein